jgi:hypothetical protein
VTHDKDFSPCVVREGARQCDFTVQKSTDVRPDRKRTAKTAFAVRSFPQCRAHSKWITKQFLIFIIDSCYTTALTQSSVLKNRLIYIIKHQRQQKISSHVTHSYNKMINSRRLQVISYIISIMAHENKRGTTN